MRTCNKICIVVSTPLTASAFLKDQILSLAKYFEVTIVANFTDAPELAISWENVKMVNVPICRSILLLKDIKALFELYLFFKRSKFQLIHSVTPKAGLLGMSASYLVQAPIRIHTFTGQVWATRRGFSRWFLKKMDWLLGLLCTHIYTDSYSQRDFLIQNRVISSKKIKVLRAGSISGVDINRFRADPLVRCKIRKKLSLSENAVVILFLGRLKRDKGIEDLAKAFSRISDKNVHLLIVGPDEEAMHGELLKFSGLSKDRVHFYGYTDEPEKFMKASDIFCLPSYREGFGTVVIEAAACGIPSVASNIYGLTDAVVDGNTGLLFSPGDISGLISALKRIIECPKRRHEMGVVAQRRARNLFRQEQLTQSVISEYLSII